MNINNKIRILIAEDESITALNIQKTLEKLGYKIVSVVDSGEDAITEAKNLKPDIILMDILLKGNMNGIEASKIINKQHDIPVIFLTAQTDTEYFQKAREINPYGFITKPFSNNILYTTIEIALSKYWLSKELVQSEKIRKEFMDASTDGIILLDENLNIIDINKEAQKISGKNKGEVLGSTIKNLKSYYNNDVIVDNFLDVIKTGEPYLNEHVLNKDKNSEKIYSIRAFKVGTGIGIITTDITSQKTIEIELSEREELFRKTFMTSPDAISLNRLEDGLFNDTNDGFTRHTGYLPFELEGKTFQSANIFHDDEERFELLSILKKDGYVDNMEINLLSKEGNIIPMLCSANVVNIKGNPFIIWISRNISEIKKSEEKLKKSVESSINTIAKAVEVRDPYTAGHQNNVSILAKKIAEEMKLDKDLIKIINSAAKIHDLGKIDIPSEILSKPGKLSKIEFELIKDHPATGYNIVSEDHDFPIPEIIGQHHERLDGSGYPNGLTSSDIHIGAKIVAVADAFEAMEANRPYRPGLGKETAMKELLKDRKTKYDPDAVDICIYLAKEKNFTFKE